MKKHVEMYTSLKKVSILEVICVRFNSKIMFLKYLTKCTGFVEDYGKIAYKQFK